MLQNGSNILTVTFPKFSDLETNSKSEKKKKNQIKKIMLSSIGHYAEKI